MQRRNSRIGNQTPQSGYAGRQASAPNLAMTTDYQYQQTMIGQQPMVHSMYAGSPSQFTQHQQHRPDDLHSIASTQTVSASTRNRSGLFSRLRQRFKGKSDMNIPAEQEPPLDHVAEPTPELDARLPTGPTPQKIREPVSFKGVPVEHQLYYHGSLPRDEILALIKLDGDFIIRESSKSKSEAVLSVYWKRAYHFPIKINQAGLFYLEGPRFPNIPQMIDYYVMTGEFVTQMSQAQLITPVMREKWELHSEDLVMMNRLGSGNFGDVYKGQLKDPEKPGQEIYVAIKTCKDVNPDEQKKFLAEARIMRKYIHPHITRLIGVVAERDKMWIVMELITGGSLIDYLLKHAGKITMKEKATFCLHAARGMAYLEEQGCMHRDLAARNCLLTNARLLKIADFGMSRVEKIYVVETGKQVPIKWTAPEVLTTRKFTGKSDVWSFGILMWEIFSDGQVPYPDVQNKELLYKIRKKMPFIMTAPQGTPSEYNDVMQQCWQLEPEQRPTFIKVRNDLDTIKQKLYPG